MKNSTFLSTRALPALLISFCICICLFACSLSETAPGDSGPDPAAADVSSSSDTGTDELPDAGPASGNGTTAPDGTDKTAAGRGTAEPEDTPEAPDSLGTGSLEEQIASLADEISGKYDLRILYGNDIRQEYRDYTAAPLPESESVLEALETLSRTLAAYPPGYFSAVRKGFCESITICLAKDLHAIDDESYLESAHAFTTVQDDTVWLVLNAEESIRVSTLIHEFTHVTDYRLLGMRELQESEWNRLNPPSFSYYNAYLGEDGRDLRISGSREYTSFQESDPEQIWFYDPYSRTYAMEDRARLMEKLLENVLKGDAGAQPDRCFSSPHIQTKLRFYFYILRQALGTGQWPEQTVWEAALQEIQ